MNYQEINYTYAFNKTLPRDVDQQAVVFYHQDCNDGLTAEAVIQALWKRQSVHGELISLPVDYTLHQKDNPMGFNESLLLKLGEINQNLTQCTLYVVDFWFQAKDLAYLCNIFKKIVVIDHHEWTGQIKECQRVMEKFPNKLELIHSRDVSGAYLTWLYFNALGRDVPYHVEVPEVVGYADDHDRYVHKLEYTKNYIRGLWSFPQENIRSFLRECLRYGSDSGKINVNGESLSIQDIIERGKLLGEIERKQFDDVLENNAQEYVIFVKTNTGYKNVKVLVVNAPAYMRSELPDYYFSKEGREKGIHLAIVWSAVKGGRYRYSLRSDKKAKNVGSEDPTNYFFSAILLANQYNGDGHTHAAGFYSNKTPTALFLM